jgi:hypothetical protein
MPNQRGTPQHTFSLESSAWAEFGECAAGFGRDRSAILRELVLWWMGVAGAELPERPVRTDTG